MAWARHLLAASLAILLLSGLVPPAPSVQAFHEGRAGDQLALVEGEGNGWAAFKVNTTGQEVVARMNLTDAHWPIAFGAVIYSTTGFSIGGFVGTVTAVDGGVRVSTTGDGLATADLEANLTPTHNDTSLALSTTRNGTFTMLIWAASEVQDGFQAELVAQDPTQVEGVTSGQSFLYQAEDLKGPASFHASLGIPGARAHVMAERTIDIEHGFSGLYVTAPGTVAFQSMTLEAPRGTVECPCIFTDQRGNGFPGTGEHTFHLSGAGAALANGEVYLAGVDLQLPG